MYLIVTSLVKMGSVCKPDPLFAFTKNVLAMRDLTTSGLTTSAQHFKFVHAILLV